MKRLCEVIGMLCILLALAQAVAFSAAELSPDEMSAVAGGCGYCKNQEFCHAIPCNSSPCMTCEEEAQRSACVGQPPAPCVPKSSKDGCGRIYQGCKCLSGLCHNGTSCDQPRGDCKLFYCDSPQQ